MAEQIFIDKYVVETKMVKGEVQYEIFAVKGKQKFPIGKEYADMCTDDYLCIEKQDLKYPELYGESGPHYVPLRTNMTTEGAKRE